MGEFPIVEATCRHGRLAITETSVAVRPASGTRWRRHHWQVPREKITGVSSYRGSYGRDLLFHTTDGHRLRAEWVAPQQALPIISMLGHASMEMPKQATPASVARFSQWVREGKLVITPALVSLKPRVLFFVHRRHHWRVPRNAVTGVLTARQPGMRMRYDVTVLTKDGGRHQASDLSPDTLITLTRELGHTTGVPPIPMPVWEDRAALSFALMHPREAPPQGLWAVEDGGLWEIEPETDQRPTGGWGAHMSARERTTSMRFGTLAAATLLCIYGTVAVMSGRAMATGASFAQSIAAPHAAKSAPAMSHHPAPAAGSLVSQPGTTASTPVTLLPTPSPTATPATSHRRNKK
jgi:hypothetical protein